MLFSGQSLSESVTFDVAKAIAEPPSGDGRYMLIPFLFGKNLEVVVWAYDIMTSTQFETPCNLEIESNLDCWQILDYLCTHHAYIKAKIPMVRSCSCHGAPSLDGAPVRWLSWWSPTTFGFMGNITIVIVTIVEGDCKSTYTWGAPSFKYLFFPAQTMYASADCSLPGTLSQNTLASLSLAWTQFSPVAFCLNMLCSKKRGHDLSYKLWAALKSSGSSKTCNVPQPWTAAPPL